MRCSTCSSIWVAKGILEGIFVVAIPVFNVVAALLTTVMAVVSVRPGLTVGGRGLQGRVGGDPVVADPIHQRSLRCSIVLILPVHLLVLPGCIFQRCCDG